MLLEKLIENKDDEYALFQSKLTPNIDESKFIGVRVPILREIAKDSINSEEANIFLKELPHKYYDENMLHAQLISQIKDYDRCIEEVNKFLPYVDNWAVCDTMSPKIFKKHKDKLFIEIKKWTKSKEVYTSRFGVGMLMQYFLDDDFNIKHLEIVSNSTKEDYYNKMMIAWYFATALAKKWNETIPYIENYKLDKWIHNKTIQKAKESYRITKEQKEYLEKYKIKK